MFCNDVKDYIKRYNVCLALKTAQYKFYGNLQFLLISIYCWKDILISYVFDLLVLANLKCDNYNSILVIINKLTKIISYKAVKITFNVLRFAEVIINVLVGHQPFFNSIVTDRGLFFISKL